MLARNETIFKWALYAAATLLCFLAQAFLFQRLTVWGVIPFVYPVVAAVPATYEGPVPGPAFALAVGVLCELLLPAPSPCFYTLVFPLAGLCAGLLAEGVLKVVMVGNEAECKAAAAAGNFDISAAEIIDPENYAGFDEMVSTMVELRKGKQSAEECAALLKKSNYFGTMLVKMGKADCLLGGATYSTADTIRPALQLVKTKKGAHLVSSCFILDRDCGEEGLKRIAMGDCAVNIDYTDTVDKATGEVKLAAADKLAEVVVETAKTASIFGIDPKVAVLSFSTKGSGKGGTVALSHDATIKAQEMDPELAVDGELQFDAAVAPEVAQVKCKGSKVAGQANTFIFPCIEAGNIGYKIAQRLGGYAAYGPILLGLNAPINDLSRGCNADEVYKMAIITAAQA